MPRGRAHPLYPYCSCWYSPNSMQGKNTIQKSACFQLQLPSHFLHLFHGHSKNSFDIANPALFSFFLQKKLLDLALRDSQLSAVVCPEVN